MARIKRKIRPLYIIAVIGALLQGLMLSDLPLLSLVVMSTLLCAVLIFFTWRVKKDFPVPAKTITTFSLLFFAYFPILLSHKMWILFCLIWFVILVVIELILKYVLYKEKFNAYIFYGQLIFLTFWLFFQVKYTYAAGHFISLWPIPLVGALLVGFLHTFMIKKADKNIKKVIVDRVLVFIVCGVVAFFVIRMGIDHLNYALDTSEPIHYSAVIEDKAVRGSRKHRSHYFNFTVNGESFHMIVSPFTYRTYNKGDTYNITSYKGAFGVPYYMAGRN